MQEVVNTTVLGLFFGTIGTTVGGIIGCTIKSQSNKFLSFMLSFAAGLMMAVICFDLIPESLGISKISQTSKTFYSTLLYTSYSNFCIVIF